MSDVAQRLRHVLANQRFPARRWELICGAEQYGADFRSRLDLHSLPEKEYRSFAEVLSTLERNRYRAA